MNAMPPKEWLRDALAVGAGDDTTLVQGARIHYRTWGPPGGTPVVLIHGGGAHAQWWDHLAPLLTDCRVVAVDLSGNGNSDWRDAYDVVQWAREVRAVADHAGMVRPVVVGHSLGGLVAVAGAVDAGFDVSGVVTIDTRFIDDPYPAVTRPSRRFDTIDDGARAFTVHGSSVHDLEPELRRHLAATSLRREGDRWRWKRDDRFEIGHVVLRELLPRLHAPLAVIRAQSGLVTASMALEMRGLVETATVDVEIPAAGHNPMLDQPLVLAGVLRTLVAAWLPLVSEPGAVRNAGGGLVDRASADAT